MAGLAAVWLAMLPLGTGEVDRAILFSVYAGNAPRLAAAAKDVTYLGTWPVMIAVSLIGAAGLLYRRRHWSALVLLVAAFTGRLMVSAEKTYFARLRPDEHLRLVKVHELSFPSGHAANSMVVLLGIALLMVDHPAHRRIAVGAALLMTFLIGLSRAMLGVHWPSDIVAGWSFGAFWLLLVMGIANSWRPAGPPVTR
ncbi:MAG: phosphatase PAP2 family protein [Sphingomicrobium sp.]